MESYTQVFRRKKRNRIKHDVLCNIHTDLLCTVQKKQCSSKHNCSCSVRLICCCFWKEIRQKKGIIYNRLPIIFYNFSCNSHFFHKHCQSPANFNVRNNNPVSSWGNRQYNCSNINSFLFGIPCNLRQALEIACSLPAFLDTQN